jgi:hypothetical protein
VLLGLRPAAQNALLGFAAAQMNSPQGIRKLAQNLLLDRKAQAFGQAAQNELLGFAPAHRQASELMGGYHWLAAQPAAQRPVHPLDQLVVLPLCYQQVFSRVDRGASVGWENRQWKTRSH